MGFCLIFPKLCGLRHTERVKQMMAITKDIATKLEVAVSGKSITVETMSMIEDARMQAIEVLASAGLDPYAA